MIFYHLEILIPQIMKLNLTPLKMSCFKPGVERFFISISLSADD